MADKRITDLPLILSGSITSTDVLPIVDVNLDITNKIEVDQLKSYILTGVNDFYVTGGTYSNGTITLDRQNGSVSISGLYTGSTDVFVTGGTYDNTTGTLTLEDNNGTSFGVTGFTTGGTGTSLYEVGSGNGSVQLVNVSGSAIGDYSVVSGGLDNTTLDNYSTISGGYKNTTNSAYGRGFIGGGEFNTISAYYGCSVIVGGENNRTYDGYRSVESNFIGGGRCNTSSGYFSTVVGGIENCSFGNCSFVGGGRDNIAYCRSTIAGGRRNSAGTSGSAYSVSINGTYNGTGVAQGTYSVYTNTVPPSTGFGLRLLITFDSFGVITNTEIEQGGNLYSSGGDQVIVPGNLFVGGSSTLNDVTYDITGTFTNTYASIIGGCGNTASGEYSTIGGGYRGTASGYASTISGGYNNKADGNCSIVAGGFCNTSNGNNSTVSGGRLNTSSGYISTVSGGYRNKAKLNGSTVSGGENNVAGLVGTVSGIYNDSYLGSTLNGIFNNVSPTSNLIGNGAGATFNFGFTLGVLDFVTINNIGEGYQNGDQLLFDGTLFGGIPITDDVTLNVSTTDLGLYSTVGGGDSNISGNQNSTVGGGRENTTSGNNSTVSGGYCNTSSCYSSTVSGGRENTSNGSYSTVSGGRENTSNGSYSTVSGGGGNAVDNQYDTIGGGGRNTTLLSGGVVGAATISGGYQNTSGNYYTFNGGGLNNITLGEYSSIVGGQNNQNISGLVQQVSFNSGDASAIPDNTYSVYPTTIFGYGSGLQISFDVNTGVVSNINVVNPGIRYEQGQQVLVSGDTIGGLSPANDLTFNLDLVIDSHYSFIGGGLNNTSSGRYSTISGGQCNTTNGQHSGILGGFQNIVTGNTSFAISCQAQIYGDRSVVIGGVGITATENDMVYMPNANIQSTGYIYIGDVNVDNSWRYYISGNDLVFERRIGGVWTNKMTITG